MPAFDPNSMIPPAPTRTGETTTATSLNGVTIAAAKKDGALLGKDDFLKLLVGQLKNQDPLEPSGNQEFISQMTQFSQLEQQTNTAVSSGQIATTLVQTGALGLIGRTVTYTDAEGDEQTGKVEQVDVNKDGKATLTVNGEEGVEIGTVTRVS
jgi:flagellar basal-body rod modification protein FlgD